MDKARIEEALIYFEEFGCIEKYEGLITIVLSNDLESLADYEYDIPEDRMDVLHTLILADQLDTQQLLRIAAVDKFILTHPVPRQLDMLKSWLKTNTLVQKDSNAIPAYPDASPRPVLAYSDPARNWYTKKEIEFFKRRNEVYLTLWENATPEDLKLFDRQDPRSLATARSALQRVFWGDHLTEAQIFRLLRADLSFHLSPQASLIAPQYFKLISELLEHFDPLPSEPSADHLKLYEYLKL